MLFTDGRQDVVRSFGLLVVLFYEGVYFSLLLDYLVSGVSAFFVELSRTRQTLIVICSIILMAIVGGVITHFKPGPGSSEYDYYVVFSNVVEFCAGLWYGAWLVAVR
jgi:hypothetical protein